MEGRMSFHRHFVLSIFAISFAAGCGSSDAGSPSTTSADLALDPTVPHYGHTDDEWGTLWWKWIYELPQTDANNCIIPFMDPTGEQCGYGQSGDVFYLAGTNAGSVVRDKCSVPSGSAIFFPILSISADNGGVDPAKQLSDADLQGYVQTALDTVPISGLSAEFDGQKVADLARFKTKITKFNYTLPAEPNFYDCTGATGVTGLIDPAYAAGFFVMLPPQAAGAHTLHFAGKSPASRPAVDLDVTYHLTVK